MVASSNSGLLMNSLTDRGGDHTRLGQRRAPGSIEVGKLADFVILSDNPLTVPEEHLAELQVLETIKEDRVVFRAGER